MTIVSRIGEDSVVVLCEELHGWPAGTIGIVVSNYGASVLIEIAGQTGVALDFLQAPVVKLERRHAAGECGAR